MAAALTVVLLPRFVTVLGKHKFYLVALLKGGLCPVFAGTLVFAAAGTVGFFFAASEQ